jgi:hypothetical protein|tara:strand:+ start:743 stop:898 length:156 start_codon:yes stop_codon:yes gene_type:complete
MGFNSYKIRDGKHIPTEKYKENWDSIFGKDKTKEELPKEEEDYIKELEKKI